MATWQIHRFRDHVAVYAGDGQTCYLSTESARDMAKAIERAARSIERERFADSSGLTKSGPALSGETAAREGFPPELPRLADGRALRPNGRPYSFKQGETAARAKGKESGE